MDAWRKRVERKHGPLAAVWVKEFQQRGAPHFHLVCFLDKPVRQTVITNTMWAAWHQIAGEGSHWHMRYGFRAETSRTWRGVMSYASKYIAKDDQHQYMTPDGELLPTGRMWGLWREQLLPMHYEVHRVTYRQYLQLRRWFRRRSQPKQGRHRSRCHRSNLTNQHTLLDYGELNRLLSWLGIIGSDPGDEEDEHRGEQTRRRRGRMTTRAVGEHGGRGRGEEAKRPGSAGRRGAEALP